MRLHNRSWSWIAAVFGIVLALMTCTGGDGRPTASRSRAPWRGGTLRIVSWMRTVPQLDPATGYLLGIHLELDRCCLLRTLMSYNGRSIAEGGSEARPDLAVGWPDVSSDGLTWTFRLREGVHYAPPFEETEIVAQDIVRALERIPISTNHVPSYPFYYSVIEGFDAHLTGEADAISGLETPDRHTLVVRLTEPTGDLPYRLAMPAAAPIPSGAADGHRTDYFRHLAASGPYMIDGSDDLDPTAPPAEQAPVAGFVPQEAVDEAGEVQVGLTLVRNPSWDPSTDPLRAAYADRIEIVMVPTYWVGTPDAPMAARLARDLEQGKVDIYVASSSKQLERYRDAGQVAVAPLLDLGYVPMNVAVAPFDDVHVRRAVNLAIDKVAIARRWAAGGLVSSYEPLTHVIPDAAEGGLIADDWRPSWAQDIGTRGDIGAARREMALSRYDHDGDGRCDDAACRDVRVLVDENGGPPDYSWFWKGIRDDVSRIGIQLEADVRGCWNALSVAGRPAERAPIVIGWCPQFLGDFPSGASFAVPLLSGDSIVDEGNGAMSLLGADPRHLRSWGYEVTSVPSVDDRIEACARLLGTEQSRCWAELDQYVMENVVPWVPLWTTSVTYLLSDRVDEWSYSVFGQRPAFDRIALLPGSE